MTRYEYLIANFLSFEHNSEILIVISIMLFTAACLIYDNWRSVQPTIRPLTPAEIAQNLCII